MFKNRLVVLFSLIQLINAFCSHDLAICTQNCIQSKVIEGRCPKGEVCCKTNPKQNLILSANPMNIKEKIINSGSVIEKQLVKNANSDQLNRFALLYMLYKNSNDILSEFSNKDDFIDVKRYIEKEFKVNFGIVNNIGMLVKYIGNNYEIIINSNMKPKIVLDVCCGGDKPIDQIPSYISELQPFEEYVNGLVDGSKLGFSIPTDLDDQFPTSLVIRDIDCDKKSTIMSEFITSCKFKNEDQLNKYHKLVCRYFFIKLIERMNKFDIDDKGRYISQLSKILQSRGWLKRGEKSKMIEHIMFEFSKVL